MRAVVAVVMGLFSGLLFFALGGLVFTGSPGVAVVMLLVGWALTAWLLQREARSVSKVVARGMLVGAAQWLAMIPAGLIFSGKALADTASRTGSDAEMVGATAGAGFMAFVTGGLSFAMTLVCLTGFAVAHFLGREMKPEKA